MPDEEFKKEEYQVLLSENYAIDTDKLNIVLKERYEKKDSKKKDAKPTGEFGWKELGYFGNMTRVADRLVSHELMKEHEVTELRHYAEVIERLRDEIAAMLTEKVVVVRREGKSKGN